MYKNKQIVLPVTAFILLIVFGGMWWHKQPKKCSYILSHAKVSGVSFYSTLADYYEGTIKNNSGHTDFLKGMVIKFYDADNILIQEGYSPINKSIISGTGIPYSVNVQFSTEQQRAKLRSSRIDIYPWFLTCK